jgi:hypothetical protein
LIDEARLQRIRSETVAVSSLLSDIFSEDIPEDPMEELPETGTGTDENSPPFAGLGVTALQVLRR